MNDNVQFVSAIPVLASLDILRSVAFFCTHLGFEEEHAEQGAYGIVSSGDIEIHFWACTDRSISESTSCRVGVIGIEALHERCCNAGIVHPNAPLASKPWETREFAVLDPDGNLITFFE